MYNKIITQRQIVKPSKMWKNNSNKSKLCSQRNYRQIKFRKHLLLFSSESLICLISEDVRTKIHKTIILLVVLYGCETLSLTLMKEHKLRVFENGVLRRIFGG
jgi:hypothetical protein